MDSEDKNFEDPHDVTNEIPDDQLAEPEFAEEEFERNGENQADFDQENRYEDDNGYEEEEEGPFLIKPVVPDISFEISDGTSMNFINYDAAKQSFSLDKDAAQHLLAHPGNLAFVFNMGANRIGKTEVFNQCLDIGASSGRFREGSKCFRLWSKAIFSEQENAHIFFVDCDGKEDEAFQELCWILAFFFSSCVLFSTQGEISELTWSEFRPIEVLAKKVRIAGTGKDGNFHNLVHLSPRLFWLVKEAVPSDFPEAFEQPDLYMHSELSSPKGDTYTKKMVSTFFREKNCLVFPVSTDENAEVAEMVVSDNIKVIKDAFYSKLRFKLWNGVPLTAPLMVGFLSATLEQYSPHEVLDLDSIFKSVLKAEAEQMVQSAAQFYLESVPERLGATGMIRASDLLHVLKELREEAFKIVTISKDVAEQIGGSKPFYDSLNSQLEAHEKDLIEQYEEASRNANDDLRQKIEEKCLIQLNGLKDSPKEINEAIAGCFKQYEEQCFGFRSLTTAMNMFVVLQNKALEQLSPPVPDEPSFRETSEAQEITLKKQELIDKRAEVERAKEKAKEALKILEEKNSSEFGESARKRKEFEDEMNRKIDKEKLLRKQELEFDQLSEKVTVLLKQKKKWWMICGE